MRPKREGYVLIHDEWGALAWSDAHPRLYAATRGRLHSNLTSMTAATIFASRAEINRALNATIEACALPDEWLSGILIHAIARPSEVPDVG